MYASANYFLAAGFLAGAFLAAAGFLAGAAFLTAGLAVAFGAAFLVLAGGFTPDDLLLAASCFLRRAAVLGDPGYPFLAMVGMVRARGGH